MSKRLIYVIYAGLFLFTTGAAYWAFDSFLPSGVNMSDNQPSFRPSVTKSPKKAGIIDYEGPKTEACPLNGVMYTKEEKSLWETKRPLAVMIENHHDSRPQSGLSSADVVYEAVAEGAITRFMALFYCEIQKGAVNKYDVGPVRSARTYFLDIASEYSDYPLYTHVGGANCSAATPGGPCTTAKKAQAIEQIQGYGWNNKGTWSDLSQFSLPYKVCRREPERTGEVKATEHTMYCSAQALWDIAKNRGLTNVTEINKSAWDKKFKSWSFKANDQKASQVDARVVAFDFWKDYPQYAVTWTYDPSKNFYRRANGGQEHLDFNMGEQITAKNIILQFVKETRSVDEHQHNLYDVIGSGKGVLIQNGAKTDIEWSKTSRVSRTVYKDKSGKEINFVPGNIWIELLPLATPVSYEG